jgi:hypothetical protein
MPEEVSVTELRITLISKICSGALLGLFMIFSCQKPSVDQMAKEVPASEAEEPRDYELATIDLKEMYGGKHLKIGKIVASSGKGASKINDHFADKGWVATFSENAKPWVEFLVYGKPYEIFEVHILTSCPSKNRNERKYAKIEGLDVDYFGVLKPNWAEVAAKEPDDGDHHSFSVNKNNELELFGSGAVHHMPGWLTSTIDDINADSELPYATRVRVKITKIGQAGNDKVCVGEIIVTTR